jgi:cytochrome c oxidase subunit 2
LLEFIHWFMLLLGVGWSIYLFTAIWKFRRKKNPKANYYGFRGHATTHIEIGVIIVEAVMLLGFAYPLWSRRVDNFPTNGEVVRVRAVGEQFRWLFQYAGPDGRMGRVDPKLMTLNNPLGLDYDDPNAQDDFTSVNSLILPIDRRVIVGVTAKDVIHNLSLVPMRIQQDATPGIEQHIWFTPKKIGEWDIVCGQLCGNGHGIMRGIIDVRSPADFDGWFQEQYNGSPKAKAEAAAKAADSPTPAPAN